jgi:hypothetical protein
MAAWHKAEEEAERVRKEQALQERLAALKGSNFQVSQPAPASSCRWCHCLAIEASATSMQLSRVPFVSYPFWACKGVKCCCSNHVPNRKCPLGVTVSGTSSDVCRLWPAGVPEADTG